MHSVAIETLNVLGQSTDACEKSGTLYNMRFELIKSDRPENGVKLIYENGDECQSDVVWIFYLLYNKN